MGREYEVSLMEHGSYVNPNPRAYERCEGEDLIKLSACANDVLSRLDDCKPDDLACECCALQSMKQECFGLCPGSPNGSFLAVLYQDCESLNDINACGLPFKKDDHGRAKVSKVQVVGDAVMGAGDEDEYYSSKRQSKSKAKALSQEHSGNTVRVKSKVGIQPVKSGATSGGRSEWIHSESHVRNGVAPEIPLAGMTKEAVKMTNGSHAVEGLHNSSMAAIQDVSHAGRPTLGKLFLALSLGSIACAVLLP